MPDDTDLARVASRFLDDRAERHQLFPSEIFEDHAWRMMLHLFVAYSRQQVLTEGALVHLANTSLREGQRWLYQLAKDGQVKGRMMGNDVILTPAAISRLRGYLGTTT